MSKQGYVKLNLGPAAKLSRRSSTVGGKVIADYIDPTDNQRYVVVERTAAKAPAPKWTAKVRKPEPQGVEAK